MANNLKKYRKAAGLTLQELGNRTGNSKGNLCDIEHGNTGITLNKAYGIAKVLDVSVYDIWPDKTKVKTQQITIRRIVADSK